MPQRRWFAESPEVKLKIDPDRANFAGVTNRSGRHCRQPGARLFNAVNDHRRAYVGIEFGFLQVRRYVLPEKRLDALIIESRRRIHTDKIRGRITAASVGGGLRSQRRAGSPR
jgi:hypothetical protein